MATDEVKEVLAEYSECETFSKWLKDNKGIDMTPEQCYSIRAFYDDYGS